LYAHQMGLKARQNLGAFVEEGLAELFEIEPAFCAAHVFLGKKA
jgi:hypothetical protein